MAVINDGSFRIAPIFDNGLSLVFSCMNDCELDKFDVTEDLPVQSFVGSRSAYSNLKLVDTQELIIIPPSVKNEIDTLFEGLSNIISPLRISKIREMIIRRIELYENFCNKR